MRILSASSIRDEGPFLLEWIAWHRLIGVTDFVIASNDCRDGSDQMLDLLATAGELVHLPQPEQAGLRPAKSIQWQALKAAWAHPLRKTADWMLISDLDEFPMIHCGAHGLADLIAALPAGTQAVALAWRLFGAAGVTGFEDRPVTAQFTRSAPPDLFHPVGASFFKSLFQPQAFRRPGVHRPLRAEGMGPAAWVDGSGRVLPPVHSADKRLSLLPLRDHRALAEMHHYSLRSVESFVVKSERGLPNRSSKPIDLHYWVERNFNSQSNEAALVLAARLGQEIARLKALPGVAQAHEAACLWHRAAFERLIANPERYRLWTACLHAAGSAALSERFSRQILARYQELDTP